MLLKSQNRLTFIQTRRKYVYDKTFDSSSIIDDFNNTQLKIRTFFSTSKKKILLIFNKFFVNFKFENDVAFQDCDYFICRVHILNYSKIACDFDLKPKDKSIE